MSNLFLLYDSLFLRFIFMLGKEDEKGYIFIFGGSEIGDSCDRKRVNDQ